MTRSRDSPSCLGASLATCSISSLKLTAPALDLDAEDLADDAPQQPLEARVLERRQRANRLFLVGLEQRPRAILDAQLAEQRQERGAVGRTRCGSRATASSRGRGPTAFALSHASASSSDGAPRPRPVDRPRCPPGPRDRRESDTRCPAPRCSRAAPAASPRSRPPARRRCRAPPGRPATSCGGRCPAPDRRVSGSRPPHPGELRALSDAELAMSRGGDPDQLRAHVAGGAAVRRAIDSLRRAAGLRR